MQFAAAPPTTNLMHRSHPPTMSDAVPGRPSGREESNFALRGKGCGESRHELSFHVDMSVE
jgi:hypothetical protein